VKRIWFKVVAIGYQVFIRPVEIIYFNSSFLVRFSRYICAISLAPTEVLSYYNHQVWEVLYTCIFDIFLL